MGLQTKYEMDELELAVDRAVLGLFLDPPLTTRNSKPNPSTFITTIYSAHERRWDSNIPTACTNGKILRINPDWFMSLSPPMRCTLLAHECWHVGFLHCDESRRGDRNPRVWNWACDHAINLMLEEFGYQFDIDPNTGQKMGLLDSRFKDMSAEQIYDVLILENPDLPPLPGIGEDIEGTTSDADKHEVIGNVVRALTASRMNAREAGSLPGALETMIDDLLHPKLPWHVLLARYFNERAEEGYNWARPNRRYQHHDLYLPSAGGQEGLSYILWGCDDSGSMSDDNLKVMNSEMKGVKERLKPKEMTVVSFDTQVQDTWEFTDENDLSRLTFTGRGGTNIEPLFEHAKARKHIPNLIVVMSDLECGIPENPGIPVLWVRFGTQGNMPSYGHVIQVDR